MYILKIFLVFSFADQGWKKLFLAVVKHVVEKDPYT